MRYFYAVFVREPRTRALLSMLRYVCDPRQKYSAHITLRGPYTRQLPRHELKELSDKVEGSVVDVWEAGAFIGPKQNTVFLHCDGPRLRTLWFKPKLPYIPHITLYDGPSREFAERLISMLREYHTHFQFTTTGLFQLVSAGGQHTFELSAAFKEPELLGIMDETIEGLQEVRYLADPSRLLLVRELCDQLFERRSAPPVGDSSGVTPLLSSPAHQ